MAMPNNIPLTDIHFETNKTDQEETPSASRRSLSVGRAFKRLFPKGPDPAQSLPPRQPSAIERGRTPPRSLTSTLPPNNPYYRPTNIRDYSLGGQSSQIINPSAMASHRGITELESSAGGTGGRLQHMTQSSYTEPGEILRPVTCEIQELPIPIADVGEVTAATGGTEDASGETSSNHGGTQRSENKTSPNTRSQTTARIAGRGKDSPTTDVIVHYAMPE